MLTKLTLDNFKNFQHAELKLGSFTVLIGANAVGKSNIREAFRFLHGIGRGYTLPDIIGEKWIDSVRVWNGIRGGTQEIIYKQPKSDDPMADFLRPALAAGVGIELDMQRASNLLPIIYDIKVALNGSDNIVAILSEKLSNNGTDIFTYWQTDSERDNVKYNTEYDRFTWNEQGQIYKPFLSSERKNEPVIIREQVADVLEQLKPMRFFDFVLDTLRKPSFPGQSVLGDSGENFSSVLYAICQDPQQKEILLSWVEELTPMDIFDFEFPSDQIGRILVTVVERNGQRVSAYSMSDGTLRFLATLAAFLGSDSAKFYFFEEIENGIHPTRLHLLTQFIENQVAQGDIQVVITTHSPLLLNYLKPETLENTSLLYRLEDQPSAHIQLLTDIPNIMEILQEDDLSRLYERGWLENSVHFMQKRTEEA